MGEGDLIAPCAGSDRDGGLPGLSDAAYFLTFSELPFGVDGRAAWVLDRPAIAGIRREPRLHSKTSQTYPVMIGRVVACVTQNRVSTASPSGPRPMAGPVGSGPARGEFQTGKRSTSLHFSHGLQTEAAPQLPGPQSRAWAARPRSSALAAPDRRARPGTQSAQRSPVGREPSTSAWTAPTAFPRDPPPASRWRTVSRQPVAQFARCTSSAPHGGSAAASPPHKTRPSRRRKSLTGILRP